MPYEAVIGLEVHVQLATETKMFCRCPNRFGAPPNTLVCPVCLGYPGTLPVINRRAVDLAVKLALALGAEVRAESVFDRKSYFYPDLPKGYQITQYDRPLAVGGRLPLAGGRTVACRRLHLEEDAGRLLHELPGGAPLPGGSLVDFNRAGVPLAEIVTEPVLSDPAEAHQLLDALRQLLLYTGVSDASLEEGSLRCDANLSLARPGEPPGAKVEVKNLNSPRAVVRALEHEVERQTARLAAGGDVTAETRGWDEAAGVTRPSRSKEEVPDYRYFPEPDLPPLVLGEARRRRLAAELPELPWRRRRRLEEELGLSPDQARRLAAQRPLADYFEAAAAAYPGPASRLAGWVETEVLARLAGDSIAAAPPPGRLAELAALVDAGEVSRRAATQVLDAVWASGERPAAAVARLGLARVDDSGRIETWAGEVLAAHPGEVEAYRGGREQLLGYFIGRVIERSGGRADPRRTREILSRLLARTPVT